MVTYAFLWCLAFVESGNTDAVGDAGKAVGPFQMWKVSVNEANRIIGLHGLPAMFEYDDRHDYLMSRAMAKIILEHWGRHWEKKGYTMTHADYAAMWRYGPSAWKPAKTALNAIDRRRAEVIKKYLENTNN